MPKVRSSSGAPRKQGFNRSAHSMNPERPTENLKGVAKVRTKSTIKRLQMYRNFKAKRDRTGKIITPAPFQGWLPSGTQARVEPNQKWFGNSRIISQNSLQKFQTEMGAAMKNPYKVVMKATTLPITLLNEKAKNARVHLLDTESFDSVFGPKKSRKKPNIKVNGLEELVSSAEKSHEDYNQENDANLVREDSGMRDLPRDWVMAAGQSKRIWNELYKVVDSSDVLLQVLDARDPLGTRSPHIEKYLRTEKPHKHLIFILNKVDLVPTWVTQRWVAILSADYPTVAFHASINHPFGKGSLINLLRQFGKLHIDKKQISVGFIGYPNVGKSSVINTLRSKKVCKVAPIAGETKVWQYITLMRRIYLIDCPGVVYPSAETDAEKVLKGVVRVELVTNPEDYIKPILERVRPEYLAKTYHVNDWKTPTEFLEKLAFRSGKLLKKGEPDITIVARMVLNDFQRGKLPYYVSPPGFEQPLENKDNENELSVVQDFNKIKVGHSYAGDDLKDLQPIANLEKAVNEDVEVDELDEPSVVENIEPESENGDNTLDISETKEHTESNLMDDQVVEESDDDSSDISNFYSDMEDNEIQTTSGSFIVHKESTKKGDIDDKYQASSRKLTSKQRRAIERSLKRKKIGSNFYEVTNVKNRNRNKKKV
ncbi:hypothetical protein ILUMI_07045 [Ignelater luminosus]|uniref:Nucleolar GTP-binding protein 2 n=1 Tax=Ignelater luminosus TaxID=2038154 RepID=A0A8K0D929_IGNLU|nr:hypothetical protein ILUMI_07045 [Ignelater luminosus]